MNEHDYPREWPAVVLRIVAARGLYYALRHISCTVANRLGYQSLPGTARRSVA